MKTRNNIVNKKNWLILDDGQYIHVIPKNDRLPHGFLSNRNIVALEGINCPCKPKVVFQSGRLIVSHNSFDDLKRIEESMSKLNLI